MYVDSFPRAHVTLRMIVVDNPRDPPLSRTLLSCCPCDHSCVPGLTRETFLGYWHGHAFIFVVSLAPSDHGRIHVAREELHRVVRERGVSHLPLLIFASKSDLNTAQAINETETQGLSEVPPWTKEELWEALAVDRLGQKVKTIIVRR